jgi:hypothetical protein
VSVGLPAIEGVLGAKIGVKPSDSSNSTITFTGPVAVTFGFTVQAIARQGDSWILHGAASSGDIAFAISATGLGRHEADATNPMVFETEEFDCRVSI